MLFSVFSVRCEKKSFRSTTVHSSPSSATFLKRANQSTLRGLREMDHQSRTRASAILNQKCGWSTGRFRFLNTSVWCATLPKKCTIDVNRMASVGNKICKNVLFCASKPIKLAQLVLQEFLSQEKKGCPCDLCSSTCDCWSKCLKLRKFKSKKITSFLLSTSRRSGGQSQNHNKA